MCITVYTDKRNTMSTILCLLVLVCVILYGVASRNYDAQSDIDYIETKSLNKEVLRGYGVNNIANDLCDSDFSTVEESNESSSYDVAGKYRDTIELIGLDKFKSMIRRIDYLSDLHVLDDNMIFNIVSGPTTIDGSSRLHTLLPGDKISVAVKESDDTQECELYSHGVRIGSLIFDEAARFIELQRTRHITGVYVSAQNAYGDSSDLSLEIVAFYSTEKKSVIKSVNNIIDDILGPVLSKKDSRTSNNVYFSPN